jgi:hypothetical protein
LTMPSSGFCIQKEMPNMARRGGTNEEESSHLEIAEREEEEDPCYSIVVGR